MSKKPTWSFSAMKTFDTCPKQYYHVKVAKDYEENFDTPAIMYGNEFHQAAEDYVREGGKIPLDPRFNFALESLDKLLGMTGEKLPEYKMGLTVDLEPCGFFDENVWFRGISDLTILNKETGVAIVIDYKTGKSARYADKGQLELMALATFKHFPEVEEVRGGLFFVVCGDMVKDNYTIKNEANLWDKWLGKYAMVEKSHANGVWNPKPSGLCRAHCIVTECPHNGRS
jgi:hypothetical protein